MKLKCIVVTMSALGLVHSVVFADTQTQVNTAQNQNIHYKKVHDYPEYKDDYKAMGALPTVKVPQVDLHQLIYDSMSQNEDRSKAFPDWFNRIGISGGLNLDGHWGNRSQGFMGENYTRVSLNDAYLNFTANINDWAKAYTSLSYSNFSAANGFYLGQYSTAYTNNQLNLEQGYFTLANFDRSPFFFQIGKQFTDYGRYQIHPLVRSMTQVMTESLQTSAKLGFISHNGLHGDVYAFSNPALQVGHAHTDTIYGAALGFDAINDIFGFDAGIGYMSNLTGVNDIRARILNGPFFTGEYQHLVGGVSVYGDVNSGDWSLSARYTTAIQQFSVTDLANQYKNTPLGGTGARPWAADVTIGYNFTAKNRSQNIYAGYQASNFAINLALPKTRYLVGYNIDLWRNTNVGFEWDHDRAYSSGNGGNGTNTNIVGARASVKFG